MKKVEDYIVEIFHKDMEEQKMNWIRHSECYYEVVVCKEKIRELESIGFTVELRDHEEKFGKKWARIYMEMNEFYNKHKRIAHY